MQQAPPRSNSSTTGLQEDVCEVLFYMALATPSKPFTAAGSVSAYGGLWDASAISSLGASLQDRL